eukprot:m.9936 g.9936  ORF g.9936 m.9936 type:complete len:563 (-) comp4167_c0_seq1:149-1837(-)
MRRSRTASWGSQRDANGFQNEEFHNKRASIPAQMSRQPSASVSRLPSNSRMTRRNSDSGVDLRFIPEATRWGQQRSQLQQRPSSPNRKLPELNTHGRLTRRSSGSSLQEKSQQHNPHHHGYASRLSPDPFTRSHSYAPPQTQDSQKSIGRRKSIYIGGELGNEGMQKGKSRSGSFGRSYSVSPPRDQEICEEIHRASSFGRSYSVSPPREQDSRNSQSPVSPHPPVIGNRSRNSNSPSRPVQKSASTGSGMGMVLEASEEKWRPADARPKTAQGKKPNYGIQSEAGAQGWRAKTNQDSFMMYRNGDKDFLAAVMDGHGKHGHHVSGFLKDSLADRILSDLKGGDSSEDIVDCTEKIKKAFIQCDNSLTKVRSIDSRSSGSTTVVCKRQGDQLFVANLGDSRAVLGRQDSSTGGMQAVPLTTDHTLANQKERSRVKKEGGSVEPIFVPGVGYRGPDRLWKNKQMEGGLAISRAFGDSNLKDSGVSAIPEVTVNKIKSEDRFVILGSDGVWDHVSNDEAVKMASRHEDPRVASTKIVELARQRWRQSGAYVDDITAVVARLDTP